MFQALIDKFSDWLFPIFLGVAVWYGVHYAVLAPRIIKVDQVKGYAYDETLPANVNECLQGNIADSILEIGRLETALYTATFRHVVLPFQTKAIEAEQRLDQPCGVSETRQKMREEQQALLEKIKREQAKEREKALARKQQALKEKAQAEYQKQVQNQIKFWMDLFTEGQ